MKATIEVKLKPFTVPNFVLVEMPSAPRQEGFQEGRSYTLSEIDAVTLDKMCNQFKRSVFEKAGKQMLPISA